MNSMYTYDSPIGLITIVDKGSAISRIFISDGKEDFKGYKKLETKLIKNTYGELLEYLSGERKSFSIPIEPEGTSFQKRVWNSLLKISYGHSKNYKEIAVELGNPNAYRAVGNANGKNPILIIIPCHRVINKDGKLGGYSSGLDLKRRLLKLENIKYR